MKSAIHYMGCKEKLLPQMLPYFPKNINGFYDLFGGSGVVSLNVKANEYHINDLSNHIYNLYKLFKETSADEIIRFCYENRDKWGFTVDETDKPKIARLNKEPFQRCRNYMNENPSTLGYYFLTFYSFCNQFRFSKSGKLIIKRWLIYASFSLFIVPLSFCVNLFSQFVDLLTYGVFWGLLLRGIFMAFRICQLFTIAWCSFSNSDMRLLYD